MNVKHVMNIAILDNVLKEIATNTVLNVKMKLIIYLLILLLLMENA